MYIYIYIYMYIIFLAMGSTPSDATFLFHGTDPI